MPNHTRWAKRIFFHRENLTSCCYTMIIAQAAQSRTSPTGLDDRTVV